MRSLIGDKTLKADAEKLRNDIAQAFSEMVDKINDAKYVTKHITFEYAAW